MKQKPDKSYLLLHEPHLYRAFFTLAWPVMLSNLLKSFHDLVDTYFIGQLPNSVAAQAGISITWPLFSIFLALSTGLSVAGVAIMSQHLGAGNDAAAKRYSSMLLTLSIGLGLLFNVLLFVISPMVLTVMGAEGGVYDAALTYLRVRSFEMIFLFIFAAFQASRQAQGDTVTPVILSTTSIFLNIILTAWFVKGLGWGVFGASFATAIGQAAVAPACLYYLFNPKEKLALRRADFDIQFHELQLLVTMAVPSATSSAFSSFGFLILQTMVLSYGDTVAAAFSLGNKVSNLLLIPISAMAFTLAAFIGQNIGAENPDRARQSYRTSRNIAVAMSTAGSLLIWPIRENILQLLTNDAATLAVSMEYMFWVLVTQPLMSLFQNYIGVFNGSGNTRFSFIVETARLWAIRLPLILFFKNFTDLGRMGIWMAMVISNLVIVIVAEVFFRKIDFKPKMSLD
ncbi:MAG: MATE family efflux transporter [Lachnospiraceae bacterium]|nr:MATE family efflux transporter [Lachnospiraceae bacterium]